MRNANDAPLPASWLIEEVVGRRLGASTGAIVMHTDCAIGATVLNVQEAIVQICLVVAATDGLKLTGTDASTTLELKGGQAALERHHKHMLATVLLTHVALGLVELVIRSADKVRWLSITIGLTISGKGAVLERNRHHTQIAGASLELAHGGKGIAIRSTHWLLFHIRTGAGITAILGR